MGIKSSIIAFSDSPRYLTVDREVKPGEILLIEKPYSSILLPEFYTTHCQTCYQRVAAPMPCWSCSKVTTNNPILMPQCSQITIEQAARLHILYGRFGSAVTSAALMLGSLFTRSIFILQSLLIFIFPFPDRVPAPGPDHRGQPGQECNAGFQDPHLLRQDLPGVCRQQGQGGAGEAGD